LEQRRARRNDDFKAEQQPVLNGLAKNFAISDKWFCSMPGATDANRAFALTGSALGQLNNFMNGPQYTDWGDAPLRGSIWKVLWANGFSKWKIYNSIGWIGFPLTYQLFLKGQIPTVDAKDQVENHIADFDRFPAGLGGTRRPVAASATGSTCADPNKSSLSLEEGSQYGDRRSISARFHLQPSDGHGQISRLAR
jgi:hypothetical protein